MEVEPKFIDPSLVRLIPILDSSRHDVIYSTLFGMDGRLYFGVSSEFHPEGFARLMSYDPKTDQIELVVDLADLLPESSDPLRPPHSKIHTTLCTDRSGVIWFATHVTAPPKGERFHRIWEIFDDPIRGFTGSHIVSYDPSSGDIRDHGIVIPREGCRFMTMDKERDELHMISYPRAHFIVYRTKTGQVIDLGRISQVDSLGPTWSENGFTYTTDDRGMFLRYDPENQRIEYLPVLIPDAPWRSRFGNRVRRMKAGPDGFRLYGFGWQSTRLFEFDPSVGSFGQINDFGLLIGDESLMGEDITYPSRSLTFGSDGNIYCGMGPVQGHRAVRGLRLLSFDMNTREIHDFGLVKGEGMPFIQTSQDMATGDDGTIYIGSFVREQPLVLICFHPDGKSPVQKNNTQPIEISPTISADGISYSDEKTWSAFRREYRERVKVFVTEGNLIARDLGWSGKMPLIPPGESSISALLLHQGRLIYGTTSGVKSHLFVLNPSPDREGPLGAVVDLGVIAVGEGEVICQGLAAAHDQKIYMGTYHKNGADGRNYVHDPEWEHLENYDQFMVPRRIFPEQQVEDLGAPIPGEGVFTLVACPPSWFEPEKRLLCGVSTPSGYLFLYDVDDRTVVYQHQLAGPYLPRSLAILPGGVIYGSQAGGQLFRFDLDGNHFDLLDVWLPANKGREYLNAIDSLLVNDEGIIYGGTFADGILFRFDPHTYSMTSLGKPVRAGRIRAVTAVPSGQIYGVAGEDGILTRLFRYDPSNGELNDLGVVRATLPEECIGHQFDAMLTGPHGEIYLGESDRISRLFTYFPTYLPALRR